jgi:peptidoglycan/LPS O-acetylase OafA/YrhL
MFYEILVVGDLIADFHEFSLRTDVCRMRNLLSLSLYLVQFFVIRAFLNDMGDFLAELDK